MKRQGPVELKKNACQTQAGHWLSLVHSSDLRQNIISFKFFFFIFGSSYYENLKVVLQPVAIWRVLLQYLWQFGKPIGKDAEVAKHLLHTQPHQKSRHLKQEMTQRCEKVTRSHLVHVKTDLPIPMDSAQPANAMCSIMKVCQNKAPSSPMR